MKEVSSPFTILNSSALPGKVKRVSLVQEGLCCLRNTRPSLVQALRKELMESLAEMIMISGYPEPFRAGVVQSAVVGYQRLAMACQRGERPLYRPRLWQQEARRKTKKLKRAAWHRPADSVLFVPATPNAELAEGIRKVVEEEGPRLGMSIRVVETGGVSLKRQLVRTDLAAGEPCRQTDCRACLSGQRGGMLHQRSGALYTGSCLLCPDQGLGTAVYTGETGYSGYTRLCEHADEIRRKDQSNAFSKHLRETHPEQEGNASVFNFEVLRTFEKPVERQVAESVTIHDCKADLVLNSKSEWEQPATERLVVTRELPDREEERGRGRGGRRAAGTQ